MDLVITIILAGVLGTLAMDLLNNLAARTGKFLKIDVAMIGRMAAGWKRGRFRYGHPEEMATVPNEPAWAVLYGMATTAASFFFVYPSMGLGVFGRRSPDIIKAFITPLANHFSMEWVLPLGSSWYKGPTKHDRFGACPSSLYISMNRPHDEYGYACDAKICAAD